MNKINFNDDVIKAINFVIIDSESVSLRTCYKCQVKFNIKNQLHHHIKQCDSKLKIKVYFIISKKIKLSLIIFTVSQVCKDKFFL